MGVRERFPETSWTLLTKARQRSDEGICAREDFAQMYYRPVVEFLLVLVPDGEKAQVLAQEFFAKLSAADGLLQQANPEKGAFRDYLRQALRNLVIDYHRHNRIAALETHPDQESAGGWEAMAMPRFPAADVAFHHAWVKATLSEALIRVRALCLKRNQQVHLEMFEARYLSETDRPPSWEDLGSGYGMDEKAARKRADTVVRHFRLVLRRMLRNEIAVPGGEAKATEAAIDEEIRALLSPLGD